MRKVIVLALVAIPIIVLLTLPVAVLLPLANAPESLDQPHGTIWRGGARWSQPGHAPLAIDWRWRGGRDWHWRAGDGRTGLSGQWQPGSGLRLSAIEGEVALERLDVEAWLIGSRPLGQLRVDLPSAHLVRGSSPQIKGRLLWVDARLEGAVNESLGRIAIDLDATPDRQRARIRSLEPAPIRVDGTIEAGVRDYELELWLEAEPDRPELSRELARLGTVGEDGRVHVQLSGALW
jgi:hypothetical protein